MVPDIQMRLYGVSVLCFIQAKTQSPTISNRQLWLGSMTEAIKGNKEFSTTGHLFH